MLNKNLKQTKNVKVFINYILLCLCIISVPVYDEINSLTVGPPLHSNPAYEKPTNMKFEKNPAYESAYNPPANPSMKIEGIYFCGKMYA